MGIVDKLRLKAEIKAYEKYAKLNRERKAKTPSNPIFNKLDELRRRVGYVK